MQAGQGAKAWASPCPSQPGLYSWNLTFSICQMGRKRIPLSPAYCKMGKTIRG